MHKAVNVVAEVAVGVDTHDEVHVAAVIDPVGRELGWRQFAASPAGYARLWNWACDFGVVTVVGVEAPEPTERGWPGSWLPRTSR